MLKISTAVATLAFCSAALADPVLYVCERPAWDGAKGCGPNNTYSTYNLLVDDGDFGMNKPKYEFRMRKGCDASKGRKYEYTYKVSDDEIMFTFLHDPRSMGVKNYSTIHMDRGTLKAVMSGVSESSELTCRVEKQ